MWPHTWALVSWPARKCLKYSDSRNGFWAKSSVFTRSNHFDTSSTTPGFAISPPREKGSGRRPPAGGPIAPGRAAGTTALALVHRLHALRDLLGSQVLFVRRDVPAVAERVLQRTGPVAVEHVGHRPRGGRPRGDGLGEDLVDVRHVQHEADGRAPVVLWASRVHLRRLVREHDVRVADLDLRVPDAPPGRGHPHDLDGPERAAVEIERARAIVDDEIRRGGVVSVRDRLHLLGHGSLLNG